jgi:Domain of unknown function (DUF4405)
MSRTTLNAIIDAVAYAGLVVLATTGLMLRWQMPPGSGGLHGMGSGAGAGSRPVTVVWGLSRHEWGSVHYWIALVLMGVLAVHLLLHWKWIVCVLRGKPHSDVSGGRFALGIAGLVLVTLLATAPLLTPAQTTPRSELLKSPSRDQQADLGGPEEDGESSDVETIRGFMTPAPNTTLLPLMLNDLKSAVPPF